MFVLLPALDLDVAILELAASVDKRTRQTRIGNQRNVVVDGCATNLVAIGELTTCVVLGNVDYQIELVFRDHIGNVVLRTLIGESNSQ